jgi:hypothetical protein
MRLNILSFDKELQAITVELPVPAETVRVIRNSARWTIVEYSGSSHELFQFHTDEKKWRDMRGALAPVPPGWKEEYFQIAEEAKKFLNHEPMVLDSNDALESLQFKLSEDIRCGWGMMLKDVWYNYYERFGNNSKSDVEAWVKENNPLASITFNR